MEPRDCKLVALLLATHQIAVDDACVPMLYEVLARYIADIAADAHALASHAALKDISPDCVRLAIDSRVGHAFTSPPDASLLTELANKRNRIPLPLVGEKYGLRLPNERHLLASGNFTVDLSEETKKKFKTSITANQHSNMQSGSFANQASAPQYQQNLSNQRMPNFNQSATPIMAQQLHQNQMMAQQFSQSQAISQQLSQNQMMAQQFNQNQFTPQQLNQPQFTPQQHSQNHFTPQQHNQNQFTPQQISQNQNNYMQQQFIQQNAMQTPMNQAMMNQMNQSAMQNQIKAQNAQMNQFFMQDTTNSQGLMNFGNQQVNMNLQGNALLGNQQAKIQGISTSAKGKGNAVGNQSPQQKANKPQVPAQPRKRELSSAVVKEEDDDYDM